MFLSYLAILFVLFNPPERSEAISGRHAVYVSVAEITYNMEAKKGEMRVKLFTDDLEDAILNQSGEKVKLRSHCDQNIAKVTDYLQEHLKLTINSKAVEYQVVECENVDISIWLECSFICDEAWAEVQVTGDHLMELFPTQSNVFTVKYANDKRMFRLTNTQRTTKLSFN